MISPQEAGAKPQADMLTLSLSEYEVGLVLACLSVYNTAGPCIEGDPGCGGPRGEDMVCRPCAEASLIGYGIEFLSERIRLAWKRRNK